MIECVSCDVLATIGYKVGKVDGCMDGHHWINNLKVEWIDFLEVSTGFFSYHDRCYFSATSGISR